MCLKQYHYDQLLDVTDDFVISDDSTVNITFSMSLQQNVDEDFVVSKAPVCLFIFISSRTCIDELKLKH